MSKKRPEEPRDRSRPAAGSRPAPAQGAIDVGEIARAVSTSFLVLVFGGLIQPVVGSILPQAIGQFWLIAVALVAFALAGFRCASAGPNPPLYGAGAAVASFLLVVPLQFIQATFDPLYALYSLIAAAVVGGIAGQVSARTRT